MKKASAVRTHYCLLFSCVLIILYSCTAAAEISFVSKFLNYSRNEDGTAALAWVSTNGEELTVPDMYSDSVVTKIGNNAFDGCITLKKITIPFSITEIADNAFEGCSDELVLYVIENSYAQEWAISHEMKYQLSESENEAGEKSSGESSFAEKESDFSEEGFVGTPKDSDPGTTPAGDESRVPDISSLDLTALEDEELHSLIRNAENVLSARSFRQEDGSILVFDEQGVSFFLTGEKELRDNSYLYGDYLTFDFIVVNNSGKKISVQLDDISVNGWALDSGKKAVRDLPAGQKIKDYLLIDTNGEFASPEEVTELYAVYTVLNSEDKKDKTELGGITVSFETGKGLNSADVTEEGRSADQNDALEEIVFNECRVLLENEENREFVKKAVCTSNLDELKTSLSDWVEKHPDDRSAAAVMQAVLDYGDYSNTVYEVDYFDGSEKVTYKREDDITGAGYYIIPWVDFSLMYLQVGFVSDDWLFADKATIKNLDLDERGLVINNKYGFSSDVIGTKVTEYASEMYAPGLDEKEMEYMLNSLSGHTVIRFEGSKGHLDYELTEEDITAIQTIAKVTMILNALYSWRN